MAGTGAPFHRLAPRRTHDSHQQRIHPGLPGLRERIHRHFRGGRARRRRLDETANDLFVEVGLLTSSSGSTSPRGSTPPSVSLPATSWSWFLVRLMCSIRIRDHLAVEQGRFPFLLWMCVSRRRDCLRRPPANRSYVGLALWLLSQAHCPEGV